MIYKKVILWLKENPNAREFDTSVYTNEYTKVALTVSGDYLIVSMHDEENGQVTTEVHHLGTVKNWKTTV